MGLLKGLLFHKAVATARPQLKTAIVNRSEQALGFVVLPERWIVERTNAWLNRCRRWAKDVENLPTLPPLSFSSPL